MDTERTSAGGPQWPCCKNEKDKRQINRSPNPIIISRKLHIHYWEACALQQCADSALCHECEGHRPGTARMTQEMQNMNAELLHDFISLPWLKQLYTCTSLKEACKLSKNEETSGCLLWHSPHKAMCVPIMILGQHRWVFLFQPLSGPETSPPPRHKRDASGCTKSPAQIKAVSELEGKGHSVQKEDWIEYMTTCITLKSLDGGHLRQKKQQTNKQQKPLIDAA